MLSMDRGKPRKLTKSKAVVLKPNSPGLEFRLRAMIELQTKLPNPATKLRADQKMPLRHNFTLQVMLSPPAPVNGKERRAWAMGANPFLAGSASQNFIRTARFAGCAGPAMGNVK